LDTPSGSIVFGPVISRRLGVSLGINNIPYKKCSYTCIYCQLGRTIELTIERKPYSDPSRLVAAVSSALEHSGKIDFATFVPDGEPTLDSNLGRGISLLKKELDVRVAVLTNASLLWLDEVRNDLLEADLVSVKIDASNASTWRRINRPHPQLDYNTILKGLQVFSQNYGGILITETMLVEGINDEEEELSGIADIAASLSPSKAYIAIPTRPPAEP